MILRLLFFFLLLFPVSFSNAETVSGLIKDDWLQAETHNFRVISNLREKEVRAIAKDLEKIRFASSLVIGATLPDENRLTMFVLKNSADFRVFSGSGSRGLVGFFQRTLGTNYAVVDASQYSRGRSIGGNSWGKAIIYHEYCHYLMRAHSSTYYPVWYEEGFCEYLSTIYLVDDTSFQVGKVHKGRIRSINYTGWRNIGTVLKKRGGLSVSRGNDGYAQSWVAVHYLMSDPNLRKQVRPYIQAINEGDNEIEAFEEYFDMTVTQFDIALKRYIYKGSFRYVTVQVGEEMPDNEPRIEHLSQTELIDQLAQYQVEAGSDRFLQELELASEGVEPPLHLMAARVEAALDEGQWDLASNHVDQMSLRHPDEIQTYVQRAHVAYGAAMSEAAEYSAIEREQLLKDAKAALMKALAKDKTHVHAIFDMATVMDALDTADPMVGQLYETAYFLNGHSHQIAFALVDYFRREERYEEALYVLDRIVVGDREDIASRVSRQRELIVGPEESLNSESTETSEG